MSQQRVNITSPVGRVVMGSLYTANTTDMEGNPLVVKTGANAGQARVEYFFGLAIPKGQETHWAQTAWGQTIWAVGNQAFQQAAQSPSFSWKIEDGDSTVPNKAGNKPCDREGWKGHWVLKLKGGYAPKVYRAEAGSYVQVAEENYIKPGYFVEVLMNVDGNNNQKNPGVYLNHSMVCFRAYGPEIVFGPDVNEAGFGQAPLPAGASMTPPAGTIPMPAPVPVVPNPQFLQVPGPGAIAPPPNPTPAAVVAAPVIPLPNVPAAPSSPKMTAKAAGASYQAFITGGWTDANLIAQGYMTL